MPWGRYTYDLMLGELCEGEEGGISTDFPRANDVTFGLWVTLTLRPALGQWRGDDLRGRWIPPVLFWCPSAVKMRWQRLATVS